MLSIQIRGHLDDSTVEEIKSTLAASVAKKSAVSMRLHSDGGEILPAIAAYNLIKQHPLPTTCTIEGIAAGAAAIIALSAQQTYMKPKALIGFIAPTMTSYANNSEGIPEDLEQLDALEKSMAEIISERSRGRVSPSDARDMMRQERWIDRDSAIDLNLADTPTQAG